MPLKHLRIAIVEGQKLVGQCLAEALEAEYEVVGVAADAQGALCLVHEGRPDVLLLDLSLGSENGFDLMPQFRKISPDLAVIVLTIHGSTAFSERAKQLGARGFVSKDVSKANLMEAICVVGAGGEWFPVHLERRAAVRSPLDERIHLTQRQIEVLRLLEQGLSYRAIGGELGLSENTIDIHLRHIRKILGGHKAVDLVRIAIYHGFLSSARVSVDRRLVTDVCQHSAT